jgi:hypothetical protein
VPWILPTSSEKLALANAFCQHAHDDQAGGDEIGKVQPRAALPPTCTALRPPKATVKIDQVQQGL